MDKIRPPDPEGQNMDSRRWNLRPAKNGSRLLPVRGAKLLAPEFWLPTSAPCQGYSAFFRTARRLRFHRMAQTPAQLTRRHPPLSTLVNLTAIAPLTVGTLQFAEVEGFRLPTLSSTVFRLCALCVSVAKNP